MYNHTFNVALRRAVMHIRGGPGVLFKVFQSRLRPLRQQEQPVLKDVLHARSQALPQTSDTIACIFDYSDIGASPFFPTQVQVQAMSMRGKEPWSIKVPDAHNALKQAWTRAKLRRTLLDSVADAGTQYL